MTEGKMVWNPLKTKKGVAWLVLALGTASIVVFLGLSQTVAQPQVLRIGGAGAYLGIGMEEVTADSLAKYKLNKEMGVVVRSVEKGSPAEEAGLQENDVILEYAGIPVISGAHLAGMVEDTPVGRKVDLGVSRDGKRLTLVAKVAERTRSGFAVRPRSMPRGEFDTAPPDRRDFWLEVPEGGGRLGLALPGEGKPRLGVTLEALTEQMGEFLGVPAKEGALVTSVVQGSPAASKLKAGDVIVRADDKAVRGPDDLTGLIRGKDRGASVELRVIRDKKEMTISIQLEDSSPRRSFKV
jgi:serine protease Do